MSVLQEDRGLKRQTESFDDSSGPRFNLTPIRQLLIDPGQELVVAPVNALRGIEFSK